MLLTYYTLRALAAEWGRTAPGGGSGGTGSPVDPGATGRVLRADTGSPATPDTGLVGRTLVDAYSSARNELTLVLQDEGSSIRTLRICVDPANRYLFVQEGSGRPRRNVTSLFEQALGRMVLEVSVPDRDRMLNLHLEGGLLVRAVLFGPRANVLLAGSDAVVLEPFRDRGAPAVLPEPRAAPDPTTPDELGQRWPSGAQPVGRALTQAMPLFDQWLAAEAVRRADLDVSDACLLEAHHFDALLRAVHSVRTELETPHPVVYREGRRPLVFALLDLEPPPGDAQHFESVDEAVRAFVRADLSERSFRTDYDPLVRALEVAAHKGQERALAMLEEIAQPSRADQYEAWGHLLMAGATNQEAGQEAVCLPDLFSDGALVTIPLDPALTGLENAQRYYLRARRTRRSREEAELRYESVDREAREFRELLTELKAITDRRDLKDFQKRHAEALARLRGRSQSEGEQIPFRRYVLEGGYEVWVGRNARQNDLLTFKHARKHDLWLHARGMPGSHTLLRHSSKTAVPPASILETAASIAAWHSKARGSGLVPVIVAERKYVRKPRKAAPGAVLVDREEVLIVPPRLPSGSEVE